MKRLRILCIIICFSITLSVFGQVDYENLFEKGKYVKIDKKLTADLEKEPDDIILNFSMAILFIQRDYKKYNPETAYSYFLKSEAQYSLITEVREKEKFEKKAVNKQLFIRYLDTVSYYALIDAEALNSIKDYNYFLDTYKRSPNKYRAEATLKRDNIAFQDACNTNTVESYQLFIKLYPSSIHTENAAFKRNALAFQLAKSVDNIAGYSTFISQFPLAMEAKLATERIHELEFEDAQQLNTSQSYYAFMQKCPQSKQYQQAMGLYEKRLFVENTSVGDWLTYKTFIDQFPDNYWVSSANDSIWSIAKNDRSLIMLIYCVDNFSGNNRNQALLLLHDVFTIDGEISTLNLFYNEFDVDLLFELKQKDYEIAELGKSLNINAEYKSADFKKYDEYIKLAAPNDMAFKAVQKIISMDIAVKNWKSALSKVVTYVSYFGETHKKISNLIEILEAKTDNSIKVTSVGSSVNTTNGGEYVPAISADGKTMYFCGRDRKDNIGGEDIFETKFKSGAWTKAKLVADLSSIWQNDAPENMSSDGTIMLLFKNGKLYYSEKTPTGWSSEIILPDAINSSDWQADAMFSSDGKAIIFASIKSSDFEFRASTNIFVSLIDENDEWSDPINLGEQINTPYTDRSPFLHPDMKTLYFCSNGHGGLGGMDVFMSTRLADTCWDCWSEPINLGKEINTEDDNWGYKISTDGTKAYFSQKSGNKGKDDIFWLNIPVHIRPGYVATISGTLVDKNNLPVSAEIRWEDLETGKNVGQSKTDPSDGSFFIVLPLGKIYGYYVENDEYFPISNNIDLRKNKSPIQIEEKIDMVSFKQMIEDGDAVPVNNLFFNIGQHELLPYSIPELKRVANIIKSNELSVEISGHTDNVGTKEQNKKLSEDRAMAARELLVNEGCDGTKLLTVGYGDTKPKSTNDTEIGRAKNRRVELRFVK